MAVSKATERAFLIELEHFIKSRRGVTHNIPMADVGHWLLYLDLKAQGRKSALKDVAEGTRLMTSRSPSRRAEGAEQLDRAYDDGPADDCLYQTDIVGSDRDAARATWEDVGNMGELYDPDFRKPYLSRPKKGKK